MKRNSTELKVKYHGNKDKKSKGRKKNPNVADISKQGYRDDSPYRSMPSIDIHTPSGIIDMSSTGIPLWANGQLLQPYSGQHFIGAEQVKEIPAKQTALAKKGTQVDSAIPVIDDAGSMVDGMVWVPDWKKMAEQAKKLGAKKVRTKNGAIINFDDNWEVVSVDDNPGYETGGPLPKHQSRGQVNYNIPVSQQDSVRNMAYKTMLYELERGSSSGTGLSDFGNPNLPPGANIDDAVKWYMKNTMSKLEPGAFNTAMEKAEAGDFIYNTGKDPRIYMLDQYLKSIGQPGLPNRSTFNIDMNENPQDWANKKPELDALWKQYYPAISKLSTNDRRILLNNGRDWYYQNIERGPGSINEDLKAYKKTWYGRIWNTNDYEPYIEKNPKFTPKSKKTGGSTNWLQQFQTTGQVSGAPNIARQVQDFKANQNIINKNNPLNTGAVSDTTRTTIGNIKGHAPKEASLSVRKDIVDPALSALSYAKYVPLPGAAAVGAAADVASLGLAAYDVYSDVSSGNTGYGTAANASKIAGKLLKGSSNPLASGVGTALSYLNKGNAAVKAGKQFSEGNYIGAALSAGKVAKRTGGTAGWLDQYQTGREVSIYPNLYDTPNRITFPITGGWDFSTKGIDNRFALTGYEREGFGKRLAPFVDLGIGTASAPESYGYGTYDSQTNASESVSPMGLGLFGKVGVKPSFAVGKSSVNPRTRKEKFNTSFFIEPSVYADVNAGKVLPRDQEAYLDALDRAKNPTTVMTDPNEKLLTQPWYASINPGARLDFSKTGRIGNIDTKGSLGVMYDQRGPGVVGSFMGESFAGSVPFTFSLEAGYQPGKEGRGFFGGPTVQIPIGEGWNKVKRKKQKASSPRHKQGGWLNQYAEGGPGMPTEETKKPEKTLGDKWITSELEEKINDPAYGDRAKYYSDWYKNQTIEKLKQSGITKDLIKKAVKGLKDKPLDDLSKAMGFDEQVTMALETGGLKNVYPDIYKNMESQGSLNQIKETLNQLGVTNTWDLMDSIYPSVMDLRYNMGVKPSDVITEDTLDNFSKTKGKDKSSLDKLLKIYSKPKLVEMMNTVAENKEPGTEIPMAKTGGPLTKAQNGIVYAPQISERDKTSTNIFVDPRVINMPNPAMSSQPFSKDFEQKYWASPMFRKRLANIHAGTEFGDQQGIDLGIRSWVDRMNKVKVLTTDALSAPSKTTLEDWDKDPELVSAYGNYNTSIPNIFLSNPQIKEINTTPEDVFFHEKGHLRNLTDYEAVEFLKRNKSLTNNPDYQMIMDGLLKDYGPLEAAGVLGEGADDPNLFHDVFPEENYSDLNALRNHMFKNKIYDASKEDLTIDVLKKALSNPAIKNSFSVKRLLKNFSPKDIVELNNKIAGIVDPAVLDKAKTGGLIKAQIGLNNMNTAVAATTSVRKPVIVPMGEPPLPEVFEIVDERKVHPVTGKKIDPKRDLKGGRYNTAVIRSIAEQSKKHGLNQDQALDLMGIAFQETLFGKTDPEIGHALHGDPISGTINKAQVFSPLTEEEANSMSERDMAIRKMIMNYVYNTTIVNKHISDRARRLQYYNTPYPKKGSVRPSTEEEYHGGKSKAFYSVPVTEDKPLSMDTNPYGLTVGSLINDLLSNNPVVKEVFKRTYKNKTGGPLLKAQKGKNVKPFVTSDLNEYNRRKTAYADSLNLYNRFKNSKADYYNFIKSQGFDPSRIEEWTTDGYVNTDVHPRIGATSYGILTNAGGGYNRDAAGNKISYTTYPTISNTGVRGFRNVPDNSELNKKIRQFSGPTSDGYAIYEKPVQEVVLSRPDMKPMTPIGFSQYEPQLQQWKGPMPQMVSNPDETIMMPSGVEISKKQFIKQYGQGAWDRATNKKKTGGLIKAQYGLTKNKALSRESLEEMFKNKTITDDDLPSIYDPSALDFGGPRQDQKRDKHYRPEVPILIEAGLYYYPTSKQYFTQSGVDYLQERINRAGDLNIDYSNNTAFPAQQVRQTYADWKSLPFIQSISGIGLKHWGLDDPSYDEMEDIEKQARIFNPKKGMYSARLFFPENKENYHNIPGMNELPIMNNEGYKNVKSFTGQDNPKYFYRGNKIFMTQEEKDIWDREKELKKNFDKIKKRREEPSSKSKTGGFLTTHQVPPGETGISNYLYPERDPNALQDIKDKWEWNREKKKLVKDYRTGALNEDAVEWEGYKIPLFKDQSVKRIVPPDYNFIGDQLPIPVGLLRTGGPLPMAQTGIPKKEVKFQGPGGTFYYDSEGKMISQAVYDQLMRQYRESPQYEKDQFQEILKNETFEEKKAREMGYSPGLAFGLMIKGSDKKMRDSYGPTSTEGVNKFAYTEAPLKDYNPYVDRVANLEGWESLKTYIPDIPRSVMAGEWEKHMYGDKRPYWATLTEKFRYIPQRGQMVNQAFGNMFDDYEDPLMSNPIVNKLIRVNKGDVAEFPGDQATYMGHPFDIPNPKYDPQYKIDRWDKVRATRDQQIRYGIDPYTGESASYYPPHYGITPPKEYEYLVKQPGDKQHPLLKKTGGSKLPVHLPEAYKTGGWLKEFQGTRSSSSVSDQTQRTAAASGALTREQLEKRIALDQMMAEKQRRERQGIIYSTPDPGMAQKKSFGLAMGMPSSQAAYLGTTGTAPALWAPVMVGSHMLYQPVSGAVNVGMGINALSDTPEDFQSVIEDPSFENAFNLGLDILFARSGFKQGKKMWNSVDLPKREVALPKNKKGGWLNGFA